VEAAFFPLALLSGYHRRRHPPKSLLNQRLGLEAPRCLNASNCLADDISESCWTFLHRWLSPDVKALFFYRHTEDYRLAGIVLT